MRDELAQRLIAVLESIACALQDTPIRKPFDTKDNIPKEPSTPEDLESTDLSDWTIPPILPGPK